MYADVKRTGGFKCSDAAMNRLHEVILRTQLGGLMSFPMDCLRATNVRAGLATAM